MEADALLVRHKTTDLLTKFELARVVGMRILQINSIPTSTSNPRVTAMREILEGTNPMVLRRKLPDGSYEDRAVKDLKLSADLFKLCSNAANVPAS